jgi:hypothetical protein
VRQAWREATGVAHHRPSEDCGLAGTSRRERQKSRDSSRRYDNRRAKANREVTRRCKSSGGPDGREPLAEQQLRHREMGWERSCRQILGSRNTKRNIRHRHGDEGAQLPEVQRPSGPDRCICDGHTRRKSRALPWESYRFASAASVVERRHMGRYAVSRGHSSRSTAVKGRTPETTGARSSR